MSEPVVLAIIGALSGGVALEIVRRIFGQKEFAAEDRVTFTRELMREVRRLTRENHELHAKLADCEAKLDLKSSNT